MTAEGLLDRLGAEFLRELEGLRNINSKLRDLLNSREGEIPRADEFLEEEASKIHDRMYELAGRLAATPSITSSGTVAKASALLEYASEDDIVSELARSLCLDILGQAKNSKSSADDGNCGPRV